MLSEKMLSEKMLSEKILSVHNIHISHYREMRVPVFSHIYLKLSRPRAQRVFLHSSFSVPRYPSLIR
jgi:hypothetical protein